MTCGRRDNGQSRRPKRREESAVHLSRAKWTPQEDAEGTRAPGGALLWHASQSPACAHRRAPAPPVRADQSARAKTHTHRDRHTRPETPVDLRSCAWPLRLSPENKTNGLPGPQTQVQICSKEPQVSTQFPEHTAVKAPTCVAGQLPLRSPAAQGYAGTSPGSRGSRRPRCAPRPSQR